MPTCVICLNALRNPAALPCGHVFCYDCIVKVVRNVQPFTQQHFCATCRAPYTIANIDSALIPTHLRPHLTPAIRKLCLDFTVPSATPEASPASECDRLRSENASLRACCEIWRKRAAVHAAASLGLVGLARLTRDEVIKCKQEKLEIEAKYNALKRAHPSDPVKYESDRRQVYPLTPPERFESPRSFRRRPRAITPSVYRPSSPFDSDESYCSDCSDCQPAMKRRRSSSSEMSPFIKSSPMSPVLPPSPPESSTSSESL